MNAGCRCVWARCRARAAAATAPSPPSTPSASTRRPAPTAARCITGGCPRYHPHLQHSVVTPTLVRAEGEAGGAGRAQPAAVPGGGGRHRPAPSCRHEGASVGRGARQGGAGRQPLQLQHRFVELKVIVNFQHNYKT